jgi:hypothetical protein
MCRDRYDILWFYVSQCATLLRKFSLHAFYIFNEATLHAPPCVYNDVDYLLHDMRNPRNDLVS